MLRVNTRKKFASTLVYCVYTEPGFTQRRGTRTANATSEDSQRGWSGGCLCGLGWGLCCVVTLLLYVVRDLGVVGGEDARDTVYTVCMVRTVCAPLVYTIEALASPARAYATRCSFAAPLLRQACKARHATWAVCRAKQQPGPAHTLYRRRGLRLTPACLCEALVTCKHVALSTLHTSQAVGREIVGFGSVVAERFWCVFSMGILFLSACQTFFTRGQLRSRGGGVPLTVVELEPRGDRPAPPDHTTHPPV